MVYKKAIKKISNYYDENFNFLMNGYSDFKDKKEMITPLISRDTEPSNISTEKKVFDDYVTYYIEVT